jgi:hypothetical protein
LAAAYRSRMLVLVLGCALVFASLCLLLPERIMALFMAEWPNLDDRVGGRCAETFGTDIGAHHCR